MVVSKNANVATGEEGRADTEAVVAAVAKQLGCPAEDVLIASTGVIGRRFPLLRILTGVAAVPDRPLGTDAEAAARGMMTTDTVPKVAEATVGAGPARVVGIAKGVGMIEPDMATMIAVLLTDAAIDQSELDERFRRVVDRTFNCVSVDTDTSTSDTAVVLASGAAGTVDGDELEAGLGAVAESLTRQIARDGEGAETLIEVVVDEARDVAQAKRVAKSIVNSPLVKTAVHGADPNWGRVAMAIGKCHGDVDIDQRARGHPVRGPGGVPDPGRRGRAGPVVAVPRAGRGAHPRLAAHRRRRLHRVGLRPDRWLRPHQRRLHDLTRRAADIWARSVSNTSLGAVRPIFETRRAQMPAAFPFP